MIVAVLKEKTWEGVNLLMKSNNCVASVKKNKQMDMSKEKANFGFKMYFFESK